MIVLPQIRTKPPASGDLAISTLLTEFVGTDTVAPVEFTSSNLTASADRLLLAIVLLLNPSDLTDNATLSGGGLTWTKRGYKEFGDGNYDTGITLFTAPITTGATFALTIGHSVAPGGDGGYRCLVHVLEFENADGTPVQTKTGDMSGEGAFTITLDSAPSADSICVAARGVMPTGLQNPGADPGTGWTEIAETFGDPGYGALHTMYRGGSTDAACTWADAYTGPTGLWLGGGIVIEIGKAS